MMIDENSTEKQIEINGLDELSKGLKETLVQSVMPKKNLSLRISEGLHFEYKTLSNCYKESLEKSLPLGDLGDQLVTQMNNSIVDFLSKKIMFSHTIFMKEAARKGITVDLVTLNVTKRAELVGYFYACCEERIDDNFGKYLSDYSAIDVRSKVIDTMKQQMIDKLNYSRLSTFKAIESPGKYTRLDSVFWTTEKDISITSTDKNIYVDNHKISNDVNELF